MCFISFCWELDGRRRRVAATDSTVDAVFHNNQRQAVQQRPGSKRLYFLLVPLSAGPGRCVHTIVGASEQTITLIDLLKRACGLYARKIRSLHAVGYTVQCSICLDSGGSYSVVMVDIWCCLCK